MLDRVSKYPGRVTLTPVPGQENTFDMVRADNPVQEGTPINKNTLLTDDVAAAIGALTGGAAPETPSDALSLLRGLIANAVKIETGSYVGTGTYGSDKPNSLAFSFNPKCVFIVAAAGSASYGRGVIFMQGANTFSGFGTFYATTGTVTSGSVRITWEENTLIFYSTANYTYQQNEYNMTYYYMAIG